jgi:hypothetical protein
LIRTKSHEKKGWELYPAAPHATLSYWKVETVPGFKPALAMPPGRQDIQHFSIAEWVDFSRGLVTGDQAAAMQEHSAKCKRCRELADYCSKLARVCSEMSGSDAPDDVVRRAYAIFRDSRPANGTD